MTENEYVVQQNATEFDLKIPSTKSFASEIALIIQTVVHLALLLLSFVIIINEFSWAALVIGGVLILWSIYNAKNCLDTYFWIKNGQEFLKINATSNTFIYQKTARISFDKIEADLEDLSNFKWCPDNDEYIDVHPRYGTKGGRICFWIKEKKHRFAISLSENAARNCILELNSFLKHTKK